MRSCPGPSLLRELIAHLPLAKLIFKAARTGLMLGMTVWSVQLLDPAYDLNDIPPFADCSEVQVNEAQCRLCRHWSVVYRLIIFVPVKCCFLVDEL